MQSSVFAPVALVLVLACAPTGAGIASLYPALPPTGKPFALGETVVADPDSIEYVYLVSIENPGTQPELTPVYVFWNAIGTPQRQVSVILGADRTVVAYSFEYPTTVRLTPLASYYSQTLGRPTRSANNGDFVEWERGDLSFFLSTDANSLAPVGYLRRRISRPPGAAPQLSLTDCLQVSPVLCERK